MDGEWFPVWGVQIRTPRLELRAIREPEMAALVDLAADGIHDPDTMPFEIPWTDLPSPELEQEAYAFWLRCWGELSPETWRVGFAVCLDGRPVGVQDVAARAWQEDRTVETGSWLGLAHQGRGYGREMRAGVLRFAFESLGAERVESTAFEDNSASIGVSESLGYRVVGRRLRPRRGTEARQVCFAMDRGQWQRSPSAEVEVTVRGVDDRVLAQLGVSGS